MMTEEVLMLMLAGHRSKGKANRPPLSIMLFMYCGQLTQTYSETFSVLIEDIRGC